LAAVNSLLKIRERLNERDGLDGAIHSTKGGRASEYYSMAKLMPSAVLRTAYLDRALDDISDALRTVSGDISGYLAIRGHILREQGRFDEARCDFEEMSTLREQRGDEGGRGEALADLGLVELELGNRRAALSLLGEGKELLERAGRHEFAIRASKRLALAHWRSLHPIAAYRELCDAYDKAIERQAFGQITPLMERVHTLRGKLAKYG
jgi:tetratricopeptide (TPR) repeat protein